MTVTAFNVIVENGSVGANGAYVYGIFSREPCAFYVGQTVSRYGALGRLAQHLSDTEGNTFQQRLCATFHLERVALGRVEFLAVRLPDSPAFRGRGSDYREAVEHLVNYRIIDFVVQKSLGIVVVSRTRSNGYADNAVVVDVADMVSKKLRMWLFSLGDARVTGDR